MGAGVVLDDGDSLGAADVTGSCGICGCLGTVQAFSKMVEEITELASIGTSNFLFISISPLIFKSTIMSSNDIIQSSQIQWIPTRSNLFSAIPIITNFIWQGYPFALCKSKVTSVLWLCWFRIYQRTGCNQIHYIDFA